MIQTVVLVLIVALVSPLVVGAHVGFQLPSFKINGQYSINYPIPGSSNPEFNLPLEATAQDYHTGQALTFELDSSALYVVKEVLDKRQYFWDFGDGATAEGTKVDHVYNQPGSYVIKISAKLYTDWADAKFINSLMVNVLDSNNFKFPQPKITTSNFSTTKAVKFSALASKTGTNPLAKYVWDFGDGELAQGETVSHHYKSGVRKVYPVLRAVDTRGYFTDTYVELPSSGLTGQVLGASSQRLNTTLARLLPQIFSKTQQNYWFVAGILFVAAAAGGLHAFTPGHGKSVMAAFLVGKHHSGLADVLTIAGSLTLSHTMVIYVLGFILLILNSRYPLSTLVPYFEKFSFGLIAILAINLIGQGVRHLRHQRLHNAGEHHHHDHEHEHVVDFSSKKSLLLAGISGGVIPCVDALSLFLLAVGLGQLWFGLLLVFSFSLGLAVAIVSMGWLLISGKNFFRLESRLGELAQAYAPIVSGCFLLFIAMRFLK